MTHAAQLIQSLGILPELKLTPEVMAARGALTEAVQAARAARARLEEAYRAEDAAVQGLESAKRQGAVLEQLARLIEARREAERNTELLEVALDAACAKARTLAARATAAEELVRVAYNSDARARRERAQAEVERRAKLLQEARTALWAHMSIHDPAARAGLELGAFARAALADVRRLQGLPAPEQDRFDLSSAQAAQAAESRQVVAEKNSVRAESGPPRRPQPATIVDPTSAVPAEDLARQLVTRS